MHQPRIGINANVCLHTEVPLLTLLALVHFRIALARLVLCRWLSGDQGGINNGAFAEQQASLGQVMIDGVEDEFRQLMTLQLRTVS